MALNAVRVLLISTYETGHQPFGIASPAAWLQRAGHEVVCADLSVERLDPAAVRDADAVAFYVPMHTACRLAVPVIRHVRELNPGARLLAYGLYAPLNAAYLESLGIGTIVGGEFENALVEALNGAPAARTSLDRLAFITPERTGLPPLAKYAHLHQNGTSKIAGYTEATRGCKHKCRHCPIVPVYEGAFRVVQFETVLADIRNQVAAGASHITFGDPDFFNGPAHARRIVEALHREFPHVTYDATIKIEHLRKQAHLLPVLKETGCVLVTSAVESFDDRVLERLEKGHTRADFAAVVEDFRRTGLALAPTFIAFTPWTTRESYREMLAGIAELDLIDNVAPVQLALRLLITGGSRLLELPAIQSIVQPFDDAALVYPWAHPDPQMDTLAARALAAMASADDRRAAFSQAWALSTDEPLPENFDLLPRAAIPYLDEPWYC